MDFEPSARAQEYLKRVDAFIDSRVAPAEPLYEHQRRDLAAAGRQHEVPAVIEELKVEARARGLESLSATLHRPRSWLERARLYATRRAIRLVAQPRPGIDELLRTGHRQWNSWAALQPKRSASVG